RPPAPRPGARARARGGDARAGARRPPMPARAQRPEPDRPAPEPAGRRRGRFAALGHGVHRASPRRAAARRRRCPDAPAAATPPHAAALPLRTPRPRASLGNTPGAGPCGAARRPSPAAVPLGIRCGDGAARGGRIASCRTYPADGDPGVNVSGLAEAGMPAPRGPRQGRYSKSPKMPCLTGERCREASERARTSSRCATYQSYDCTNISSFDQRGVQPSFALACERSKNISRPYISEWYAPSGERPSALVASIAGITSRAGSERTRLPVPACCTSASSASRIGPEALGANVEGVGPRQLAGADARLRQVVGVDKLVTVVAAAEDPDRLSAPDPLEEDLEHAKPAVAQDRSRPHDGDVEPLALDGAPRDALGLELGVAVRLSGPGLDRVADGVARRDAEDGARGDEDDLADTPARAGAEQVLGAAHVHALEQVPILRERHLGDVVVDDVDP